MTEINAIVASLENGLANQFIDIPPATLSILRDLKEKGVVLALTSSRSIVWLEHFLESKQLKGMFSFLIGCNGVQYLNCKTRQRSYLVSLSKDELLEIARNAAKYNLVCGVGYHNEIFFNGFNPWALNYAVRIYRFPHFSGFGLINPDTTFSKVTVAGSRKNLRKFEDNFDLPKFRILHPSSANLEVVPTKTNMFDALKLGMAQFGLSADKILYFGESEKDQSAMFHTIGIAMKNAQQSVKDSARRVTKYNGAQNGIGYQINLLRMDKVYVFRKPNREKA